MGWKPDYVTADELLDYVHANDGDPTDGPPVDLAVTSASRGVDGSTFRQFGRVDAPEARYYDPCWDRDTGTWRVEIDDLMTTTGLVVAYDSADDDGYASPITSYRLLPRNAAQVGRPWRWLEVLRASSVQPLSGRRGSVRVTGRWGWTEVPSEVKQAVLMQGNRFFARRNAPFGVAGSPDQGSELRLLAKLDPDVEVTIRHLRRWWGAR